MTCFCLRWAAVLLFAFTLPATSYAQLGGLGKKIKNAAKSAAKTAGDIKATINNGEQTVSPSQNNTSTTTTNGSETHIYGDTWQIANYKRDTKQFIFSERKYKEGQLAGKPITYTYDEASGEVRDADGTLKGTIGKGFVEIPGVGKVSIINEQGGLSLDGTTTIGRVTNTGCTCYGTSLGSFSKSEPREIVAFFFLSECAIDGKMEKLKKNFETRKERQAKSAAAFKEQLKTISTGSFLDLAGNKLGSITADGKVLNKQGSRIGQVKANGGNIEVYNTNNQCLGYISEAGLVYKGSEKVGQLNSTGRVELPTGATLGNINGNDFYDSKSNRQGSFSGKGVYVAAALRYFFFAF